MLKKILLFALCNVMASGAMAADVSSQVEGFEYSRGFYTESDLGLFLRFGGWTDVKNGTSVASARTQQVTVSNVQPYIGFSVGYDVLDFLSLQLSYGTGYIAGAAPRQNDEESPLDHSITFLNVACVGNFLVLDRVALEARVFAGGALFSPAPSPKESLFAADVGGGLGVKYMTLLPGFIIGADVNFYMTYNFDMKSPLIVPALSFSPLIIKYVF